MYNNAGLQTAVCKKKNTLQWRSVFTEESTAHILKEEMAWPVPVRGQT